MRILASGLVAAAVWLVGGSAFAAPRVVINELLPNATGVDTNNEWLELYNAGDEPADIGGYKVQAATSPPFGVNATKWTIPAGTTLAPGGYFVVGGNTVLAANLQTNISDAMGNAADNGDAVRLTTAADVVVDTVVYGPTSAGFSDDSGAEATSMGPRPYAGLTLARVPNGTDTNLSAADFVIGEPTLGAANTAALVDGGAPTDAGTDASVDASVDSGTTSSSSGATSSGSTSGESSSGESSSGESSSGESSSGEEPSSSSGGKSSSSSGGRADAGKADAGKSSSGGKSSSSGGDDETTDEGGCNSAPGGSVPLSMLIGIGALAVLRRRRRA